MFRVSNFIKNYTLSDNHHAFEVVLLLGNLSKGTKKHRRLNEDSPEEHSSIQIDSGTNLDLKINQLKHAIKKDPYNADAYYDLGEIARARKEHNTALNYYKTVINIDNSYGLAHARLGECYSNMGDLDNAITHYHKVLSLYPDDEITHMNWVKYSGKKKNMKWLCHILNIRQVMLKQNLKYIFTWLPAIMHWKIFLLPYRDMKKLSG
jgi:tetratricopeptide (TPR) repeat protein